MSEELKVVMVGAASPQWGYGISRDIIVTLSNDSGLSKRDPVFVLEDIDPVNLEKNRRLAQMLADVTGNKVRVESTTDQRAALKDASFVVISLAVGTLEAMKYDLEIPMEYGIYQPVGDTTSIGGAIRIARNAPVMAQIGRDMEELSKPGAWLLNLSNPMSALTRTVTRETSINTVGLCHEIYGGIWTVSGWFGLDHQDWRRTFEVKNVGINHCGFMQGLKVNGEDMFPKIRAFIEEKGITEASRKLYNSDVPEMRHETVKLIMFLRHGVLPYSGDRHTSEFFTEFINKDTDFGADYGVMLTTIQQRMVEWRGRHRQNVKDLLSGKEKLSLKLSSEAVAHIIRSVTVDEPFFDTCNLPYNGGNLPGVPKGAVIERMCTYDGNGAHPVEVEPLPDPLQANLALHAGIIEDVIEASLSGNRDLMIEAVIRDPLMRNMNSADIPELWDRLASDVSADTI